MFQRCFFSILLISCVNNVQSMENASIKHGDASKECRVIPRWNPDVMIKKMPTMDPMLVDSLISYAQERLWYLVQLHQVEEDADGLHAAVEKLMNCSLVFEGPTGVGKTDAARAFAQQIGRKTLFISRDYLFNQCRYDHLQGLKYNVNALFESQKPCVIIIDGLEGLTWDHDAALVSYLCTLIDECKNHNAMIIITTSQLSALPPLLAGRFSANQVVTFSLPILDARKSLLHDAYMRVGHALHCDGLINAIAEQTEGLNCWELESIVHEAIQNAAVRFANMRKWRQLGLFILEQEDFKEPIRKAFSAHGYMRCRWLSRQRIAQVVPYVAGAVAACAVMAGWQYLGTKLMSK